MTVQAQPPEWQVGKLCTSRASSNELFERIYNPKNGELAFDRRNNFWRAVAVAHEQNLLGQGRRVAVLDSGFDIGVSALEGVIARESDVVSGTIRRRGPHGTLVALLLHEVAPQAELLLIDIARKGQPLSADVALALGRVADRVDVVNLSLQFPSDCPLRDLSVIDSKVLASPDPPEDRFLDQVRTWLAITDPYEPGGCRRPCPLCATLRGVREQTFLVGAAGNSREQLCPACSERCLALGFEKRKIVTREGGNLLQTYFPDDFTQNLLVELLVPQPPELQGTSFAAPLAAGFAALVKDREAFALMTRLPIAMYPLQSLLAKVHTQVRGNPRPWEIPAAVTLEKGFHVFGEAVPEQHRHWNEPNPGPCATCSLLMVDWYTHYISLLILVGRVNNAAGLGEKAVAVIPRSSETAGTFGEALARLAMSANVPSAARQVAQDAAHQYRRAIELSLDDQTRATWQKRLDELLLREPWLGDP